MIDHMEKYEGWDNPVYSNIESLKALESAVEIHDLVGVGR
jgi:hypothetical protein